MAIRATRNNSVTFSDVFSDWTKHATPFHRENQDGSAKQAWLYLNLASSHISIRFTNAHAGALEPVLIDGKGIASIPLPSTLTGRQMDALANPTLASSDDRAETFYFYNELKEAASHAVDLDESGKGVFHDGRTLLLRLKRIQGHLEDLAAANEVIDARQLSLAALGLKAFGDDGRYHKDFNEVTQVQVKATGEWLTTHDHVTALLKRLEARYSNTGTMVALVGFNALLLEFAEMTRGTQQRLINHGTDDVCSAQNVYDRHNPVEIMDLTIDEEEQVNNDAQAVIELQATAVRFNLPVEVVQNFESLDQRIAPDVAPAQPIERMETAHERHQPAKPAELGRVPWARYEKARAQKRPNNQAPPKATRHNPTVCRPYGIRRHDTADGILSDRAVRNAPKVSPPVRRNPSTQETGVARITLGDIHDNWKPNRKRSIRPGRDRPGCLPNANRVCFLAREASGLPERSVTCVRGEACEAGQLPFTGGSSYRRKSGKRVGPIPPSRGICELAQASNFDKNDLVMLTSKNIKLKVPSSHKAVYPSTLCVFSPITATEGSIMAPSFYKLGASLFAPERVAFFAGAARPVISRTTRGSTALSSLSRLS